MDLPNCNTHMFQLYLDKFSGQKAQELKIIVLDNGAFHKSKRLKIPANIALLFLPPYSPELNPAEKIWRYLKDRIAMKIYKHLSNLQDDLQLIIEQQLSDNRVKSITNNQFYKNNFYGVF